MHSALSQRDHCLAVLHKLGPHHPAWLDVVANLLARPTVINSPTADKPSATWDVLPRHPLSTPVFSTVTTDTVKSALRQLTSEVQALSYVDDIVHIGPADLANNALQPLPSSLRGTGLELQPAKTQIWAPRTRNVTNIPALRELRSSQGSCATGMLETSRESQPKSIDGRGIAGGRLILCWGGSSRLPARVPGSV